MVGIGTLSVCMMVSQQDHAKLLNLVWSEVWKTEGGLGLSHLSY